MMKQYQNIEQLKKVRKVDAPPFLLTRIHAKINALREEPLPTTWKWAGAFSLAAILLLNVAVMRMSQQPSNSKDAMEVLASGLQLSNANQLYHE